MDRVKGRLRMRHGDKDEEILKTKKTSRDDRKRKQKSSLTKAEN